MVDDPQAVFRVAVLQQPQTTLSNTVTAVGYLNPYYVGSNLYSVTGTAGSTLTGDSAMGVSGAVTVATSNAGAGARVTTTLPFRCLGVVPDTAVSFNGTGSTSGSSATVTMTSTVASYGPTLPGASAALGIVPGMQLICTGSGTVRTNVSNYATVIAATGSTLTLDSAVTLPASSNLTFIGYPEVLVSWNFGYNCYFNAVGA